MFAHSINRAGTLRRGFTLIEILAVVIILGIMSAVIIPQMGTRDSSRVASAARQLTADLIYAQNRAVTLQKTQYVVFNTGSDKYDLASSYSPLVIITNPVTSGSYETVFGQSPLEGVTLGSVSFDGQTTVAFNELGVPMSVSTAGVAQTLNSGSVVIQAPNASLTVSVQPYSGEVKVQYREIPLWPQFNPSHRPGDRPSIHPAAPIKHDAEPCTGCGGGAVQA